MQKLRKALGRVKYKVLDEWPYLRQKRRVPELKEQCGQLLHKLPPVAAPKEVRFEVHMLCGHRDYQMGIWSSWSLMRFVGNMATLFVHSDGSLTDDDLKLWRQVIPGLVVIPRAEADAKVAATFKDSTKELHRWRCSYGTSPQLVDAHLFGDAPGLLIMDSDVLVFSSPDEMIDALLRPMPRFAWCRDTHNAYSADPKLLQAVTGITMPERFNCGMLACPRLGLERYQELDAIMSRIREDGRIDLNRYWACQTYYGMLAAAHADSAPLPDKYDTTMGRTPDKCIVRHYVGAPKIRFRMFTEGIPRLLSQLEASKNG